MQANIFSNAYESLIKGCTDVIGVFSPFVQYISQSVVFFSILGTAANILPSAPKQFCAGHKTMYPSIESMTTCTTGTKQI